MSNSRKNFQLKDIVNIQSSTRIFEKEYVEEGIPFYRSKEIIEKQKGNDVSTNLYISQERFNKIKQAYSVPRQGDILLTSVGTIGIPYMVRENEQFYFKDGNLTWFNNFSKEIDNKYFYYWLLSEVGKEALNSILIGTTQKALTIKDLKSLEISLPPLSEQKRISSILSSFDNKIEQLKKENNILEDIAQSIFKEWFVKYNFPNKDGKPYKDNNGKMIDSELGLIPEGWRVEKLGEIIEFSNGYAFKSEDLLGEEAPNCYKVFKMGNIKKGGGLNTNGKQDYIDKNKCRTLTKYVLHKGDLLMSMTDMKDNVSLLGNTALMNEDNRYIVNQRVGLIRSRNDIYIDFPYLYLLTNNDPFLTNLRKVANSGVQVNLSTQAIKDSLISIPKDKQILKNFDSLGKSLFEKIFNNEYNVKSLKEIKTALLNKLIPNK